MTTAVTKAPMSPRKSRRAAPEPSVAEIIRAARSRPAPLRGGLLLTALTGLLLWASFTPLDWGPLGWVCLVPMLQLVRVPRATRGMFAAAFIGGCLFTLPALQWMRLGDPTMYLAWLALAVYWGLYFPAFLGLARLAVHRYGVPLLLAAPVAWVGLEYLRAHLLTGFPWYFLGHTQHRWLEIVQISDLVGAYGASALLVLGNASLAELVPVERLIAWRFVATDAEEAFRRAAPSPRSLARGVVIALLATAACWGYGRVRIAAAEFTSGPRIALIQGNFTTQVKHDPEAWRQIYLTHRALTGLVVPDQPDVVVWPESMYREPLLLPDPEMSDEQLAGLHRDISLTHWKARSAEQSLGRLAAETNARLIIGIDTLSAQAGRLVHYNSAVLVEPGVGLTRRYDKLHRVPFGEYIPLREAFPFLQKLTPYAEGSGIAAGGRVEVFDVGAARLLPLICFEDTVPHLVRAMTSEAQAEGKPPVSVLVNLTNDGWFHGSSELDQHLITARFRCIENRLPMVRAVNTGISAFIDGHGAVRDPAVVYDLDAMQDSSREPRKTVRDPETGRFHKRWNAAFIADVPLDGRFSLYTRTGDWFAGGCCVAGLALALSAGWSRLRRRPHAATA